MPVSGSSYTYAYATLGEVFAWVMGWLIVLEYGVAGATVAVGFSGTTITWAHHSLIHGDREGLKKGLWATVILGAVFSMIQAYEYAEAPLDRKSTRLNSSH